MPARALRIAVMGLVFMVPGGWGSEGEGPERAASGQKAFCDSHQRQPRQTASRDDRRW